MTALTTREIGVAGFLFAAVTAVLTLFSYEVSYSKHLDSVFLFEALESIRATGVPDSASVNAMPTIVKLFGLSAADYCASPMSQPEEPYHVLDNHAYFALYLLAPAAYIASPEAIFALMNTLAHLVLVFVPYLFLRWRGLSILNSILFIACVGAYAAWSLSFTGDYYMDRLYMLFLTPVLFGVHVMLTAERIPRTALAAGLACALAAALCTERGAIMVVGLLTFHLLFHWSELRGKGVRVAMAATIALVVAHLVTYFVFLHPGMGGAGLLAASVSTVDELSNHVVSAAGCTFLVVNLMPLGIFALCSGYRYVLLAIGSMLPNLVIPVGGAELTGWTTHYHAMYIPFVVFAACVGYERFIRWCGRNGTTATLAPLATAASLFVAALYLDPYTGFDRQSDFVAVKQGVFGKLWYYYFDEQASPERWAVALSKALAAAIPRGASVSAMESVMPSLYAGRRVYYFPLGLEKSDYLVMAGTAAQDKPTSIESFITYGDDPNKQRVIQRCVLDRIQRLGYEVINAFDRTLVLRRNASG